jgi:hypothetical protein
MKISIPTPCSENWDTMQPREQARFCASCQKCVIDFTTASDTTIVDFLNTKKEGVCGRFNNSQLDRALIINRLNNRHRFGMVASLLFFTTIVNAQNDAISYEKPLTVQQLNGIRPNILEEKNEFIADSLILQGVVLDSMTKEPLVGASVHLYDTSIGVLTDVNGNFKIIIPKEYIKENTIVAFSFTGYLNNKYLLLSIDATEKLEINLSANELLGEVIVVGGVHTKYTLWRRVVNFFKRLF